MVKFNESDGVWRTIGGRRVFIRDGQNLSDAMKESGKFKSAKKKEEKTTKSGERDKRTITKKEMEESFREDVKKDPEFKAQIDKMREEMKARDQADRIKYQKGEIEKASGLKVKEAWEADLYGNGKEDRFELSDGRIVAHTKEALGEKKDTWSIETIENGSIESKDFKSYDDMIKHLGGSDKSKKVKSSTDSSKYRIEYEENKFTGEKTHEVYKNDIATIDHVWDPGASYPSGKMVWNVRELDGGEYGKHADFKTLKEAKEAVEKHREELLTKKSSSGSDNNAYKKAFEEYKKKHPNSKLNLQKFIDMSEGK